MMKTFTIDGKTGVSRLLIGEQLTRLERYLPSDRQVIVVTDATVGSLYGKHFPSGAVITIGSGETHKTLDTLQVIYQALIDLEADRTAFIVGIGGGIVCDVTGFAASTYLRGVRFGYVPTTLLAQVDASVGGKTGVNFGGYKNMVGVFNQPEFVLCDLALLNTLPVSEIVSGYAEVVKHAVIGDAALFHFMEENARRILDLDPDALARMVYDSVALKAGVVSRDEKEAGERRILNFGHTLGHAIEKVTGVSHGEAVSAGMGFAAALSVSRGRLKAEDAARLEALQRQLQMPVRITADADALVDALRRDKKRTGDAIHFVLLDAIGRARFEAIPIGELTDCVRRFCHGEGNTC